MKLTDFCKNDSFHAVLALTYNIDAHFFEKVIYRNLLIGNASDVIILADGQQVEEDIERNIGELRHLGRDYLLHPVFLKGTFHPKMLLRLNEKGAKLCLGSGNLSFGGWGGSQEIAATWEFDKRSAWQLNSLLNIISEYITDDFASERFRHIRDQSWLLTIAKPEEMDRTRILITPKNQNLSMLLSERWEGRRFDSLHILTGSTDKKGTFIQWCHDTFGIKNCIVGVNPEFCSFHVRHLQKIPVSINISPFESKRRLHAKFYLFDGPDGAAAIMGSANCSYAAWMMEPAKGGNVESIIIYDDIDKFEVMNILNNFPDEHIHPKDVLTNEVIDDSRNPSGSVGYYLTQLSIDEMGENLIARFSKALDESYKIECVIMDLSFYLTPVNNKSTEWIAKISTLMPSKETLWGIIKVENKNGTVVVFRRWIDYPEQLRRSAIGTRAKNALRGLSNAYTTSEQRKVLEDLHYLGDIFIHSTSSFPDFRRRDEREQKEFDKNVARVTPEKLIRSLKENNRKLDIKYHSSFMYGSPLKGIMKILFDTLDDEKSPEESGQFEEELVTEKVGEEDPRKSKIGKSKNDLSEEETKKREEHFKAKLNKEFSRYLDKLSSEKFAKVCTARQMVEACAFMLAVAAKCMKRHSEYEEIAREWIIRVCEILFFQKYEDEQPAGLFNYVKRRYSEKEFNAIVGDGNLWVVFLVVLGIFSWEEMLGNLKRAFILKLIYERPELIKHFDEYKFNLLIKRIEFENAEIWFRESLPGILKTLSDIEDYLDDHFNKLIEDSDPLEYRPGDWFYRKGMGWAFFEYFDEESKNMHIYLPYAGRKMHVLCKGFYINVRQALVKNVELNDLNKRLKSFFR